MHPELVARPDGPRPAELLEAKAKDATGRPELALDEEPSLAFELAPKGGSREDVARARGLLREASAAVLRKRATKYQTPTVVSSCTAASARLVG